MRDIRVSRIKHPRYRWGVFYYVEGKQVRKYRRTEAEAKALAGELQGLARAFPADGPITDVERDAVLEARRLGVDLLLAVRAAAERLQAVEASGSLELVLAARMEDLRRGKRSQKYMTTVGWFWEKMVGALGRERLVATISQLECRNFLFGQGWGEVSLKYFLGLMVSFFKFAEAQGLCAKNPCVGITIPKSNAKRVAVASPAVCEALLRGCDVSILPGVAFAMFAGLRPESEMQRLVWERVHRDRGFLEVSGEVGLSKTGMRRLVKLEPALVAWIDSVFGEQWPAAGRVWPTEITGRRRWREAKCAAGFGPGNKWPGDLLRHSFASYHLAMWEDAAATALQLGHTSTKMLFQHYREVVMKGDAVKFWGICP